MCNLLGLTGTPKVFDMEITNTPRYLIGKVPIQKPNKSTYNFVILIIDSQNLSFGKIDFETRHYFIQYRRFNIFCFFKIMFQTHHSVICVLKNSNPCPKKDTFYQSCNEIDFLSFGNNSATKLRRIGDKGSPCLTPL